LIYPPIQVLGSDLFVDIRVKSVSLVHLVVWLIKMRR
jgi:hypothetical protein